MNTDPRMKRLLQAAALLRDHSASRMVAAKVARAESLARLNSLDPAPLDSADAELHRVAQRHSVWAELHRHGLQQDIARQDAALRDLHLGAARAQARWHVLQRHMLPRRDQSS